MPAPFPRAPRRLLRLVLNPDGAPLSPAEGARLEALLWSYARKQGFEAPAGAHAAAAPAAAAAPVPRALLHAYPTIFFLREAAPALRAVRARASAAAAAAGAAAGA